MATLVPAQTCPLPTLPTTITPRATLSASRPKSFTTNNVGHAFCRLKHVPKFQFSQSAQTSSIRSWRFKTAISCSANPETLQAVQSTIAKQLSIDVSTVAPATKFSDLGADSLDTVEIMMALEEQFGVSIGEGGAENIVTVQDAADLIENVKAASA